MEEAEYLIKTKDTIRNIAERFKVSKSTVHKDMQERLITISPQLDNEVKKIFQEHLCIRHIKGGEATRKKYFQK